MAAGFVAGVLFLVASRRLLKTRDVHVGQLSGAGVRRSVLVFGVLLVHSLPEGFAIGTAFASETEGLGLFVILAIELQKVPEGTSVAIPMEAAGFRPRQQFWAAVLTSAPQPIGALVAYTLVEQIEPVAPLVRVRRGSDAVPGRGRACARGVQAADAVPCRSAVRPRARR